MAYIEDYLKCRDGGGSFLFVGWFFFGTSNRKIPAEKESIFG